MGVRVREKPKGSGIWWVFIDHQNNRKAKKIGKDKKLANEVAKKIEARLVLGSLDLSDNSNIPMLKEYIYGWTDGTGIHPGWLKIYAELSLKQSTRRGYEIIIRDHLLPSLSTRRLDNITGRDISSLIYQLFKKGLRSQTIKNIKNCLSAILRSACQDDYIKANPAHGVIVPKPELETPKREPDPWSWEERDILEITFKRFYPFYYPLVICGLRTGLRIGELTALKWEDIDFANRQIYVQRNFSRGRLTTPKSAASKRFVRMTTQLIEVLRIHKEQLENMQMNRFRKWDGIPEWVFPNEAGNRINYGNFLNRVWNKAMKLTGLSRRTPHDMRHTYATLRLSNGDSLAEVSKEMGHGSPDITFRTYYMWLPKESRTDIDALDNRDSDATKRNLSATKIIKGLTTSG
jgi:integrase